MDTIPQIGTEWWIAYNIAIVVAILIDLNVFHSKSKSLTLKQSSFMVTVWLTVAVLFGLLVMHYFGKQKAIEFSTAYLIEISLSMDNVFVFALIFHYFSIPSQFQYRILFWGIIGAFVMRGLMIILGVALIQEFSWIMYVFGVLLIYSGIKMLRHKDDVIDPNNNLLVRIVKKIFPIKDDYEGNHFFTRHNGKLHATTLFVALIVVEFSDLVFAIDSIPAIFAVSLDPFILYTSNTLAITGLRSLYFALASVINRFYYLNHGLCALLVFVGFKMILSDVIHVPALLSLAVIVSILAVACIASIIKVKR